MSCRLFRLHSLVFFQRAVRLGSVLFSRSLFILSISFWFSFVVFFTDSTYIDAIHFSLCFFGGVSFLWNLR